MKSIYLILVFGIFLFFACNKDEDLFEIMPESDLIALEGMAEAYEHALLYNDSLMICASGTMSCDSATMIHYDEMFHQFDEMFDDHHQNYSHNNVSDDHHHEGNHNIRHGSMMNAPHGNEDEHGYEHNMNNFEEMMYLRERHDEIHPH